jgi:hypothetical protein
MVGELDVAIADQKATIEFLGDHVLFRFADYKTARAVVGQPMPSLKPVGRLLSWSEIGLKAKIGNRKAIELYPSPSWIVRWLSPSIREMVGG